jgi:uncharacterized protein involved in cysteine biosynthesis
MAVAMRRMTRRAARQRYAGQRGAILLSGGVLALAGLIPVLNLLIPVIGTAVMVHLLHQQFPPRFESK